MNTDQSTAKPLIIKTIVYLSSIFSHPHHFLYLDEKSEHGCGSRLRRFALGSVRLYNIQKKYLPSSLPELTVKFKGSKFGLL